MIDARLTPDEQEDVTPAEAVAAMILTGLGFANKPLSLTPQFLANKPLDLLFRQGVQAEMFNRFKLSRTLDEAYAYGCDGLLSDLALAVCAQAGIAQRFHHLDTTSFALSGDYMPERVMYPLAADNVSSPLPCRLKGVKQPVIRSRNSLARPHPARLPCL